MIYPIDKLFTGNLVRDCNGNIITVAVINEICFKCLENGKLYIPEEVEPIQISNLHMIIGFEFEYYPMDGYEVYWTFMKDDIIIIVDNKIGALVLKDDEIIKVNVVAKEVEDNNTQHKKAIAKGRV